MLAVLDYQFFPEEFETKDQMMDDIILTWALSLYRNGANTIDAQLQAHSDGDLAAAIVTACGFDISVNGAASPMAKYGFTAGDLARAFRRFRCERAPADRAECAA